MCVDFGRRGSSEEDPKFANQLRSQTRSPMNVEDDRLKVPTNYFDMLGPSHPEGT